jgi:hypothetical protein
VAADPYPYFRKVKIFLDEFQVLILICFLGAVEAENETIHAKKTC